MSPEARRRRRVLTRLLPIALLGVAAFVAGAIRGNVPPNLGTAQAFVNDWQRQDFAGMYAQISPASASQYSIADFTATYARAQATATVRSVTPGEAFESDTAARPSVAAPLTLATHSFGRISGQVVLPLSGGKVDWAPNLVYPGLRPNERLARRTKIPRRAPILAKDGTPLAAGPAAARSSPLGAAAAAVAGSVSAPTRKQDREQGALGFPAGTPTGTSGLELAFNQRLAGRPGGQLVALPSGSDKGSTEGRILVATDPIPGKPVHTTIDPDLQTAAVAALGSNYGGVAVLDAQDGSVLAVAGIAFSGPQPPGSTFKIVTTTAALDAGVVKVTDEFPIETSTTVDGREIANAHDEACGGSFAEAFAESCNSVFVPLGPKVGSKGLVGTAERYGFNSPPTIYARNAVRQAKVPSSTLPSSIPNDIDLAVSAIGQGEVLATPLEMASVAQTIANGGVLDPTNLVSDRSLESEAKPRRVTSSDVAATLRSLMIGVVTNGTGIAAALPGIQVAGKTGTAELGPVTSQSATTRGAETAQKLDAWFTAFAPASDPKLAVAAMVVDASGDGGTIAAPIVRQIMATAFGVS